MQWCLLKEEDVIPRIRAMEGRRGRPPNPDRQRSREESRARRRKGRPPNVGSAEFLENTDAKLLRKLQAQGKKHNVFGMAIIILKSMFLRFLMYE